MSNTYFQFKEFHISQELSGMKVTTDACLFGAWVAREIQHKYPSQPLRILDIGTGTGLLSLMIAQKKTSANIIAVEKESSAAAEASRNFANSPWSDRLRSIHSSVQEFSYEDPFDVIVANPPFFSRHPQGRKMNKNAALHDNSLSREELLTAINANLHPEGHCFLLYPAFEMDAFKKLAKKTGLHLITSVLVRNNKEGDLFREMCCFSKKEDSISSGEIIIREENNSYTTAFWELLAPYYLEYNNPANRNPMA